VRAVFTSSARKSSQWRAAGTRSIQPLERPESSFRRPAMQRFIEAIVDSPFGMLCVLLYAAAGLITGVWVAMDARKHRVPTYGRDYNVNTGAVAWFVGCLFLWPLVVPVYFLRRASVARGQGEPPSAGESSSLGRTAASMGRSLIALVILVGCGIL